MVLKTFIREITCKMHHTEVVVAQTTVINNMAILAAIEEDILEVATIVVEAVISDTVDAVAVPVTMI